MSKKKVSFSLSPEIVGSAKTGIILGDFNNWDEAQGVSLKKQKDGSLTASVSLEAGKTYEYRYLLEDGRWVNDNNASEYTFDEEVQSQNCVIVVPEASKKPAAKSPAKKSTTAKAKPTSAKDATVKKSTPAKKVAKGGK